MKMNTEPSNKLPILIKPAPLGSISSGTLRMIDLLDRFMSELEWQIRRSGDYFALPENFGERDRLTNIVGEAQDCWNEDGDDIYPEKEDVAEELVVELQDALQRFAPDYCYFGSHYGDGADFGFWPDMDAIDELPTAEDTDEGMALGEAYKTVNDHGNVEVYDAQGNSIIGIV